MGQTQPKHEFAKVTVVHDEDSRLCMGDSEHFGIDKTLGVLVDYRRDIVTLLAKESREAHLRALVTQEPHIAP